MKMGTAFSVSIAGVGIRFEFPFETEVPEELRPFLTASDTPIQVSYKAELRQQLCPWGEPVANELQTRVYRTPDGWLRFYSTGAAVLLTPDGNHKLLFEENEVSRYRRNYTITPLLGAEYVLAQQDRLLLHSSAVCYRGAALLFSGPSGIGKSTQAELWRKYAGAEVINGDRCVISRRSGGFFAYGSPFCGSSGIRRQVSAPIGAMVFLEQGEENELREVSCLDAYRRIYSQTIANPWDGDYTRRICDLIETMIRQIPMYVYHCRPDESAVETLKEELIKRQIIFNK